MSHFALLISKLPAEIRLMILYKYPNLFHAIFPRVIACLLVSQLYRPAIDDSRSTCRLFSFKFVIISPILVMLVGERIYLAFNSLFLKVPRILHYN